MSVTPSQRARRPKGAPFEASIVVDENGCHIWTGAVSQGYGNFTDPVTKRSLRSHVYAWERVNGRLPAGMHLHHRCDVKLCANPAPEHLQLVTPAEHQRIHGDRITHCPAGHEYTDENTYVRTRNNGRRQCRACHARQVAERRARND